MKKKYVVELTKEERPLKLVSAGEASTRRRMLNRARVLSKADASAHCRFRSCFGRRAVHVC